MPHLQERERSRVPRPTSGVRVLSVHAGADTGGISWGISQAFARFGGDIEVVSSVRTTNYIQYPNQLPWDEVPGYGGYADVIHVHNTFRTALILGLAGKPKVLHHHGTHYRDNANRLNAEVQAAEARAVVSTLDLLDYGTDLTWIPAAYDPAALPKPRPVGHGPLRVGHAPTNRDIKSTDKFLAACDRLDDVEPVLIEGKTHAECLQLKATCDVYFDQVQLGYGCNAIEAWFLGLPVIAGAPDSTLSVMQATFGDLPFWVADEPCIQQALKAFTDPDTRAYYANLGRAHAHRWHNGTETVARLTKVYESVLP